MVQRLGLQSAREGDIACQQMATGGGGPAGRQGVITDQIGCQQRLGGS